MIAVTTQSGIKSHIQITYVDDLKTNQYNVQLLY